MFRVGSRNIAFTDHAHDLALVQMNPTCRGAPRRASLYERALQAGGV